MTDTDKGAEARQQTASRIVERPLADLGGVRPPAPDWFTRAIAAEPAPQFAIREGRRIEYRCWGDVRSPAVMLLHGNLASARWWSWIAPWLARNRRVVAMTFPGMGLSDPCDDGDYSPSRFLEDIQAVAAASDLFAGPGKPMIIGHSAAGGATLWAAAKMGDQLAGAILVDSSVHHLHPVADPSEAPRALPVFADLAGALARFRLAPPQPCDNLFIADFIARAALRQVDGGWTWSFDPRLWNQFRPSDGWKMLPLARCPLVFVNGEKSVLTGPPMLDAVLRQAPAGTRFIEIPEAHHHIMIDQPVALTAVLEAVMQAWDGQVSPTAAS